MSTKIYANARFGLREDTLENWITNDPVLEKGEPAVVRDGENGEWLKIGDGMTPFSSLPWKKVSGDISSIIDINYMHDSPNPQSGRAIEGAIAGRKTKSGGEIFNDYENNMARTPFSSAKGTNTVAGGKGYKILNVTEVIDIEGVACSIVLDSVEGLEAGMVCSATIGNNYTEFAKIVEVISSKTSINIDTYPQSPTLPPNDEAVLWIGTLVTQQSGMGTTTIGAFQSAEGDETVAIHESAHAEGRQTVAIGKYSHAEGRKTTAGYAAHSEGYGTKALGNNSHAEGNLTVARGLESHAEGYKSYAYDRGAHAEGVSTEAKGYAAHSEGLETIAEHDYSHTSGLHTKSGRASQTVVGTYNDASEDALFVVGNGSAEDKRKNAFEVKADGSAVLQKMGTKGNSVVTKDYVDQQIPKITADHLWKDISNTTLSDDAFLAYNTFADGEVLSLKAFRITVDIPVVPEHEGNCPLWVQGNTKDQRHIALVQSNGLKAGEHYRICFYGTQWGDTWEFYNDQIKIGTDTVYSEVKHGSRSGYVKGNLTRIALGLYWAQALPKGTKIFIQGVNA